MRYLVLTSLLLLGATFSPSALAQECTTEWAAPVDGEWTDVTNWTDGVPNAGDVACITAPGTYTVALTNDTAVDGLILGGESGMQTLTTRAAVTVNGDAHVRPNARLELINRIPGGADGIYLPNGTLLVEGEVVTPGGVSFLTTGGTLDVAPGGALRLVYDGGTGARLGSPDATFDIRGVLEADCASATCQVNAPLDLDDGTIRMLTGRLDIRAGGTLRDLTLAAAEGTTLYFNEANNPNNSGYVLEGTISGEPAGDVYWSQTEIAAGSGGATLALGGTGFQLVGVGGSFLTSAGGEFLNTGLLTRPSSTSNFSGIDGVTVRNEGRIAILNGLVLRNGAEIRNEVDGVIAFTGSGNLGSTSEEGQLISRGLIVVEPSAVGTLSIQVPVDIADTEIRVEAGRLDIWAGGTLRDLTLDVAAETQLWFRRSQIDGEWTRWVLEGTITGMSEGDVRLTGTEVAAGPDGATLGLAGTGFRIQGGAELASAGGDFLNTGLVTFLANSPSIRGVTIANEGILRVNGPHLVLSEGGIIENRADGTLDLINGGGVSGGPNGGQVISYGSVVARLEGQPTGNLRIAVPVVFDGSTIHVTASRLHLGAGLLTNVMLDIAEESELLLTAANSDGNSGIFVVDGTLSGDIAGEVRLTTGELQAAAGNSTLNLGGNGLMLQGSGGTLASAGGDFLNTGLIAIHSNSPGIHGVTVTNESMIRIDGPSVRLTESAVIENRPNGTVEFLNGGNIRNIDDTSNLFINEGLVVHFSGTSDFDSTLRSQPGSEILNLGGRVDLHPPAEHSFPEGTLISGTSQVRFLSGLLAEGTISPGTDEEPLATLEFVTSFQLTSSARLVLDIDDNGQGDLIIPAAGQASTMLGGTLVVRPRPGFTPAPGDEWTIILRSTNPYNIQGEFDAIEVEGDVPEGIGFITEKPNAGVVVLRAVAGMASIIASSNTTTEGGAPVTFTVSSSTAAPPGSSLEVPLDFGGTATRFLDYVVSIPGDVVRIPAGQTSTTFTLFALSDDLVEGDETVMLSLLPGGDIVPGPDGSASVTIADGLPTSALAVGGIVPSRGGQGGYVTASLFGQGFAADTDIRLVQGGTVISGTDLTVDGSGTGASSRFDLREAPVGSYDVVVSVGDQEITLQSGFTVEPTRTADVWADISGTPNPRLNRWSTYTLTVGNDGNADVHDTFVMLRLTVGVDIEILDGIDIDHGVPEAQGIHVLDAGTAQLIPLYVYRLRAGEVGTFRVRIRPGPPIVIGNGVGVSFDLYPPSPEAAFTWSGDPADQAADQAAGIITNWALMGGGLMWAIEQHNSTGQQDAAAHRGAAGRLAMDMSFGGQGSSARELRDGDLNNSFPPTDTGISDNELASYNTAGFFNNNLTEIEANAPSFTGEFGGFLIGGVFLGVGVVVASVPIIVAAGIAVTASAASTFHKAGRSSQNVMCLRNPSCGSGGGNGGGDGGGNGDGSNGTGGSAGGKAGGSADPNDKLGPNGVTDQRYVRADTPAHYTIRYENIETATFPAQEVIIVDDLDLAVYDLSTFSLGPITLPDRVLTPPPGAQSFHTTIDLSPELPALLIVNADLDQETGRVVWSFITIDPNTNDLPEDGLIGFLPPNVDQPEGEGSVSFNIDTLPDLTTNTDISNIAEIFFDLNDPIVTPAWSNLIDRDAPSTTVEPLPPTSVNPVTINVAGSDLGSGIHTYALFVSEDDGPFELYHTSSQPTFEFEGELNVTYGFYSTGIDNVMNIEAPQDTPEAITTIVTSSGEDGLDIPRELTLHTPYPNPMISTSTLKWGLPAAGEADIRVYDILGREVLRLVDNQLMPAGWHETTLSANLASGSYIVRLATANETRTQRLVIVR